MNVKTELRRFLKEKGIENGKSIILKELDSIEKEYFNALQTAEVKELENEMYTMHLTDLNINITYIDVSQQVDDELRTSIYRVSDPVEPITIGMWDTNLTEGRTYRINKVAGDYIVIRDDSGELNPYLKARFLNKSDYLPSNN
jgi:hypothetical protein